MTEQEKIPYPTEEQINQQIEYIVARGLPERKPFLEQIMTLQRQLGWGSFLPNRGESFFTAIAISLILLLIFVTTGKGTNLTPHYFALLFMLFRPISSPKFYRQGN